MYRRLLPVLIVAGALCAGTVPATATVVHREHFSGTETFSFDECGFVLDVVSTFSGSVVIRSYDGEAFLGKTTFRYRDVLTNRDTGEWFVVTGHGVFKEVEATHVEGTIYEFRAVEAGQPFVIEDSEGNVIVRDRGAIMHTALFDTLGDGEPGGELIEETGAEVHGPHPAFAEDFPFCEIAAELTGAT